MNTRAFCFISALSVGFVTLLAAQQPAGSAGGTDHVAAIKESLQKSMAALRQYQWVETTSVSLKGEEKSRTQNSCQYGADGEVQKTPIGDAPQGKSPRGVRGRIAKNKKEGITDSIQEAVAVVKQYVPPDPARIQAAKDEGRLSVQPPDSKGRAAVVIDDYLKAGDSLILELDAAGNRLSGMTISTYAEKAKDAIGMKVSFGKLDEVPIYPATIQLDVAASNVTVVIENSGYTKLDG